MARKQVQWAVLLVVVVLATALRVYQLKDVPAGLFCDEAANGYNAYALATAGIDENGVSFPLFVWSFGVSYKNPVFIYAATIPVKLLGLDEFSIRLTAALFGVGTIIAIFFLGRALFGPWVGVFAAGLLTVCPWHLHFSRIAFELIAFPFLFVTGLTFLVRFTQGRRTLPAALFFLGSCVYSYAIAYLFVPLFLVGFALLYLPMLLRRWRETALALLVVMATVSPAAVFLYQHPQSGTRYFRATTNIDAAQDVRAQAEHFLANYEVFFSRTFLFESGDPIVRHSVRGFGELLPFFGEPLASVAKRLPVIATLLPASFPFYDPLLILGAVVALAYRDRASKLVLWWLVLYPVGATLMTEIPSASRGFIGVPAFCLLTALGLAAVLRAFGWLARWRPLAVVVQTAALVGAGYVLTPQVLRYLHAYFVDYPKYSAPTYGGFQYGYRDAVQYMESQRANYDLLVLTSTEVNQPQIFPMFYNHLDPRVMRLQQSIGYQIFVPIEYARYSMDRRILYALRPSDLSVFTDYTIHREIVAPGGQVEFVIAEVRARKRYLMDWLALGPFDNGNHGGERQEFIDPRHPPHQPVAGPFGQVRWERIPQQFVHVNLNQFYLGSHPQFPNNPEWVCAYAATTLHSPTAQSAFLELAGSDDPVQVWLNGNLLTPWALVLAESPTRRAVNLNAGDNALLVKSCESIGTWFFTARITDADGHDLPDVTPRAELSDVAAAVPAPAASTRLQLVDGFASIVRFKAVHDSYPGYRGGIQSWAAAVRDADSEVVWQSAPCPKSQPTVLAFDTSMSDEQGEADLYVNGQYALTFHLGPSGAIRSWTQGDYHLTFMFKQHVAGNSGVMLLTIPPGQVTAGQPVELRVVPARGDGAAWFMVQSYRDTIAYQHFTPDAIADAQRAPWTH